MKTIKEIAESYAQWILRREGALKSAQLPKVLEGMLKEQKAIDDDAMHAIVEEQVLKAINKQKAIDDAECMTMVGAAVKEAKQVFIDKAKEWLEMNAEYWLYDDGFLDISALLRDFCKAMEK